MHIFQNQLLRWNRELKPVVNTMNPKNRKTFFLPIKGSSSTVNQFVVGLKPSEIKKFFFSLIYYTLELLFPAGQKDPVKNQYFNPL